MTEVRDLVLIVADQDIAQTCVALLGRPRSLGIRPVTWHPPVVHANRDPGCCHTGHELAARYVGAASHALVVLDAEWNGAPTRNAGLLAGEVEQRLRTSWGERQACIVVEPEIEAWVFSDSPHVDDVLGWKDRRPPLRDWLIAHGYLQSGERKPVRPKEAFERALREVRRRRSSALLRQLAERVGVERCIDPSFRRLLDVLRRWFPS